MGRSNIWMAGTIATAGRCGLRALGNIGGEKGEQNLTMYNTYSP
jgi:hypothetical protein